MQNTKVRISIYYTVSPYKPYEIVLSLGIDCREQTGVPEKMGENVLAWVI